MRIRFGLLVALLLLLPARAFANWTDAGIYLTGHPNDHYDDILDNVDGGLIVWRHASGGLANPYVYSDRVDPLGNRYPNWDPSYYPPHATYGGAGAVDGLGGLYKVMHHFGPNEVRLSHVMPAGGMDPTWPSGGVLVATSSSAGFPAVAADGANGALAGFTATASGGYRVKRVLPDGTFDPGWSADGRLLGSANPLWMQLSRSLAISDGAGGAYFAWPSTSLRVHRIASSSAPVWAADMPSSPVASCTEFDLLGLFPLGNGSFGVAWYENLSDTRLILVQRFDENGSFDPAGPLGSGVPTGVTISSRQAVPDGQGGVWLAWQEGSTPKGTHIRPDGSVSPDGAQLLPPGVSSHERFRIAAGPSGGLVVAWTQINSTQASWDDSLRARWLLTDGTPDPSQPVAGRLVAAGGSFYAAEPRFARSDANGGAYVVFNDGETGGIRLKWLPYPQQSVDVPPAPGSRDPGLLISPNPVSSNGIVHFTMRTSDASLEVLDLGGRVMTRRPVRGAGFHAEPLDLAGTLAPGVYLVRLIEERRTRVGRFAIVR